MTVTFRTRSAATVAELSEAIATSQPRVAKLLGPTTDLEQDPTILQEALETLRGQHEELSVASEELREQVNELARMSTLLESERQRYADLFALSPDAHLVTDLHGTVTEANEAASVLFRIERRFLRAKPLAMFVGTGEGDALHELLTTAGATPAAISLRLRPRGGGEITVDARVRMTARGRSLIWILRVPAPADHAVEPERALRDQTELLERERRLRADLERSNRAKDRFIAVLTHDLRAPLNAILGWAQLLKKETLDRQSRERGLGTIERNANAVTQLLDQLLDISRLEADKLQLTNEPINFSLLVERAVDDFLPAAEKTELALLCHCEPHLTVIGDRSRLEQILGNVLSNALKYTPAGGQILVSTRRAGNDKVRLTVTDTGQGIAADLLPLVFDMNVQDRGPVTARRGLGLGLHIVRQLVEMHFGSVRATSDGEGLGTTITIDLPLSIEIDRAPSEAKIVAARSLDRLHVLVVDDEADERELIGAILSRAGAQVMCAEGHRTALDVFETWRPDVVISDIMMPEVDGRELLTLLRRKDPNLAAIAISGLTSSAETELALASGFDGHIGKPIAANDLVEAVDEAARMHHR